jgi:hypothetical protein
VNSLPATAENGDAGRVDLAELEAG